MAKQLRIVVAAVGLIASFAAPSAAQPACGSYSMYNSLTPYGSNASVELIVRTNRDLILCPLEVQAEGWVNGVGGAETDRRTHAAEVHMYIPIGINGTYYSSGKHWIIWNGWQYEYLGSTSGGPATITGGMCSPPIPEWQCTDGGGHVSANGCNCEYDTPIIADVNGDGYRLTNIDDGVSFDLDADGQFEQVAWTRPDSDDAFLAMDRNNNGKIDNGSELFGNATPAYNDQPNPNATNGFVALKFAEGPSYGASLVDGIINTNDVVYGRLLLWQDKNHNGYSEPDELRRAAEVGLVGIGSNYRESKRKDRHGNMFALKAKSWWLSDGGVVERPIFDVSLMSR